MGQVKYTRSVVEKRTEVRVRKEKESDASNNCRWRASVVVSAGAGRAGNEAQVMAGRSKDENIFTIDTSPQSESRSSYYSLTIPSSMRHLRNFGAASPFVRKSAGMLSVEAYSTIRFPRLRASRT